MFGNIMNYVNLGLWLTFLLALVFAFIRSFKGNICRLIATLIVVILVFILLNPISNVFSTMDISRYVGMETKITPIEYAMSMVSDSLNIENFSSDSALVDFVGALASSIVRVPVFILLTLIGMLVLRPILIIILRIVLSFLNIKKFWLRFVNMGIALVTYSLTIFMFLSLILGLKGFVQNIVDYVDATETTSINQEVSTSGEFEQIKEVLEAIDNQSYFRVVQALSGKNYKVQTAFFGNMTRIETKNGKFNLVKEVDNLSVLVPLYTKMQEDGNQDALKYIINNRVIIIDTFKKSESLNILMPVIVDVIGYSELGKEIDIDSLRNINWKDEKDHILDILGSVLNIIGEANLDLNNPVSVLGNTNLANHLKDLGKTLNSSNVVKSVVLVYLQDALEKGVYQGVDSRLVPLLEIIDLTELDLENDFYVLGSVLNKLYALNIFTEGEFNIIKQRTIIAELVKLPFELSTSKGNEKVIIETLIDFTGLNAFLEESNISLNLEVTNWQNEINILASTIENILALLEENNIENINNIDLQQVLLDSKDSETTKKVIEDLCRSEIFGPSLLSLIDALFESVGLDEYETVHFKNLVEGVEKPKENELSNELEILLDVLSDMAEILETDLTDIDVNQLNEALHSANKSNFIEIGEIIIDYLNKIIVDGGLLSIDKRFVDSGLDKEEWDVEFDNIVEVIRMLKDNEMLSGDMSNLLKDLNDEEKISSLLKAINKSEIFRIIIPDILSSIVPVSGFKTEWLTEQCGVDSLGINQPMASTVEWNVEIDYLVDILLNISDIDINNIDLASFNEEQLEILENILIAMNNSKSFSVDIIVQYINDVMISNGLAEIIGVSDRNKDGKNTDEWNIEIPLLIETIKMINAVGAIESSSITINAVELGQLLDQMKISYLFGNDTRLDGTLTTDDNIFNAIIIKVLTKTNLLKTASNPNGFIKEEQALDAEWSQYNWQNELSIIASFDTSLEEQTDEIIKTLSSSLIIKDFYDIASIINNRISDVKIEITSIGTTLNLKDYINDGNPLTNEDLRSRNWSNEIDDFNQIIEVFNTGNPTQFKEGIDSLIATGNDTIAVSTAAKIKSKLFSFWDII